MQNIVITKSEDEQHLYIHDTKLNTVYSYQLLKKLQNRHYFYIWSHTFENYMKGMFGKEVEVDDKLEDLGHHIIYTYKSKRITKCKTK